MTAAGTGAVRVAAVDGAGFEVTHFLASESIRSEPERVTEVFPAALSRVIHERVGRSTSRALKILLGARY